MIKNIFYNYYYKKFMKENSKNKDDINWNTWSKLDKLCTRFSK